MGDRYQDSKTVKSILAEIKKTAESEQRALDKGMSVFGRDLMLQGYIAELEADQRRLEFVISEGGQLEYDTDHGYRWRFWSEGPKSGVGPWSESGRKAIDEAMGMSDSSTETNAARLCGARLQEICHDAARTAGWWGDENSSPKHNPMCFAQKLCLIHSEISEAMEGDRKSLMDDHLPHREMREVELADAVIRIFDLAGAYDMDLGSAIAEKMAYNQHRADHKPENREQAGGKAY